MEFQKRIRKLYLVNRIFVYDFTDIIIAYRCTVPYIWRFCINRKSKNFIIGLNSYNRYINMLFFKLLKIFKILFKIIVCTGKFLICRSCKYIVIIIRCSSFGIAESGKLTYICLSDYCTHIIRCMHFKFYRCV